MIDEGSFNDSELARQRNLVALLFRLEDCRQRELLEQLVGTLVEWLQGPGYESLRRAFAVWLEQVILVRLSGARASELNNLWERSTMLSEWLDEWGEEMRREADQKGRQAGRQEGEASLLIRQLRKRFGELPDFVGARLREAPSEQLEHWGERLLEVKSLSELFNGERGA